MLNNLKANKLKTISGAIVSLGLLTISIDFYSLSVKSMTILSAALVISFLLLNFFSVKSVLNEKDKYSAWTCYHASHVFLMLVVVKLVYSAGLPSSSAKILEDYAIDSLRAKALICSANRLGVDFTSDTVMEKLRREFNEDNQTAYLKFANAYIEKCEKMYISENAE